MVTPGNHIFVKHSSSEAKSVRGIKLWIGVLVLDVFPGDSLAPDRGTPFS